MPQALPNPHEADIDIAVANPGVSIGTRRADSINKDSTVRDIA